MPDLSCSYVPVVGLRRGTPWDKIVEVGMADHEHTRENSSSAVTATIIFSFRPA